MKPLVRIALASLAGLAGGWTIQQFRKEEPSPAPAVPSADAVAAAPGKNPAAEWGSWLEEHAPLVSLTHAGAFWQHLPPVGDCPKIEWELALDEAFFNLPPDVFLTILSDERFSRFPRLYEVEQSAQWSRKLMGIGLDVALGMAGQMPTAWLNAHLDYTIRETLARQDPERGYEWLKLTTHSDQSALSEYLEQVARHDVDKAGALFAKLDPAMRWYGSYNLLKTMGAKDWRKAEVWGKANLTPEEWQEQVGNLISGFTGKRMAEVRRIGDETADPFLKSAAYSRAVFWPVTSIGESMDRALALTPGTLNARGWDEVGKTCAMRELDQPDPAASAESLRRLALRVPEENRKDFLLGAVRMACWNDGPLGAQFYDLLKPADAEKLSGNWAEEDPAAASAWLATLPPSDKREAAVLAFCREATSVDPGGAASWALTVTDATQRETAVRNALAAWRQSEPAAAQTWAESKGLSGMR